ncbi:MAG: hypothetical protein HXS48_12900 [Theionarchaea archaeon]|nr:hypothetical protein [Theionarchaea archaeon]
MIFVEDIPESGLIIVSVLFNGYKHNFQNDSRRDLLKRLPNHVKEKCGVQLVPIQFSLIRSIERTPDMSEKQSIGRARTVGVEYRYRFEHVEKKGFEEMYKEVRNYCSQTSIWRDYDIMFADYVGEINE